MDWRTPDGPHPGPFAMCSRLLSRAPCSSRGLGSNDALGRRRPRIGAADHGRGSDRFERPARCCARAAARSGLAHLLAHAGGRRLSGRHRLDRVGEPGEGGHVLARAPAPDHRGAGEHRLSRPRRPAHRAHRCRSWQAGASAGGGGLRQLRKALHSVSRKPRPHAAGRACVTRPRGAVRLPKPRRRCPAPCPGPASGFYRWP